MPAKLHLPAEEAEDQEPTACALEAPSPALWLGEIRIAEQAPVSRAAEESGDQDPTGYALQAWSSTLRLCAIRIAEAAPVVATVIMLWLRH